jgi:gliding motility-associated-like protein
VASQQVTITVVARLVTNVTTNSPVCEKNTLSLSASGGTVYQWTGPNGFTGSGATVSIPNVQLSNAGKYYVAITNAGGCSTPQLDSAIVAVNISPVATTPFSNVRICEGDNVTLGSNGGGTYEWIPTTGLSSAIIPNPKATPADTTLYSVVVTNQFSCHDTADIMVNVVERPRADAGPDKYIIKGTSTQIMAVATGQDVNYSWAPAVFIDNAQALQPIVNPPQDTSYVLTVVSNQGCGTATDTMRVYVYKDIYIPNAFSPNNDGLNDTWLIPALRAYSEYTISVYNRYGQLIFYTKNNSKAWDGKFKGMPQPVGVYVYMVEIKDVEKIFKGTLMLVR